MLSLATETTVRTLIVNAVRKAVRLDQREP
jgi:hypothetical protein